MRPAIDALLIGILVCAVVSPAEAQEAAAGQTGAQKKATTPIGSPWSASLTSYMWFSSFKGDLTVRNLPTAHIDVGFSDIFHKIDWSPPPIMWVGTVRYDRFSFITDFIYLGLEDSVTGNGPLQLQADATLDTIVWTFAGGYRFVDTGRFSANVLAGGRLWHENAGLKLQGPNRSRNFGTSTTWVDPIIGMDAQVDLGAGFSIHAEGDVGGFGAAANLEWQLLGTVQYKVTDWLQFEAGYRHLAVDYNKGNFQLDAALSGPIIGGSVHF